jgi:hypothetical protein
MDSYHVKEGDIVIAKEEWPNKTIGLVVKVVPKNEGFDNIHVAWPNGKITTYYYWMLQVINESR